MRYRLVLLFYDIVQAQTRMTSKALLSILYMM